MPKCFICFFNFCQYLFVASTFFHSGDDITCTYSNTKLLLVADFRVSILASL